jgi:signal transduction histidine kinase
MGNSVRSNTGPDEFAPGHETPTAWLGQLVHDLRGPLAPVTMAISMLQSGRAGAAQQSELHAVIQRQIEALTQLLDDTGELLTPRPRHVARTEVASLLDMTRVRCQRRLAAQDCALTLAPVARDLAVHGDPRELVRLLSGLMVRCAEIAGRGNGVVVRAEATADGTDLILSLHQSAADTEPRLAAVIALLTNSSQNHVADAILARIVRSHGLAVTLADPPGLRLHFGTAAAA